MELLALPFGYAGEGHPTGGDANVRLYAEDETLKQAEDCVNRFFLALLL